MKKVFLFFALTCLVSPEMIRGQIPDKLFLEEAIRRALEHNFDIRAADILVEQAVLENQPGNAGLLPDVHASAGGHVSSSNSKMEFADGRTQEVNNAASLSYQAGLSVNYTVFAAGRAWKIRQQLSEKEERSRLVFQEQLQSTISEVIQTYARVVWQQQQLIAIDTGLSLARTRMELSRVKYETGASAKVDYLQARVDYNARQSDSLAQMAVLSGSYAALNALMGADPFLTYRVEDSLVLNTQLEPSSPEYLKTNNITLDIWRKNVGIARLDQKIAQTDFFPQLDMNAGYQYQKSRSESGFAVFSQNFGPSAGLSLNIPIFQSGNIRRRYKIAGLEALRQEILLEKQSSVIAQEYRTAWADYETSVAAYQLEHENIRFARENVDIQKARFEVGIGTTLEAREAENSYVQALMRLYTAAYQVKVNETRVLELESTLKP